MDQVQQVTSSHIQEYQDNNIADPQPNPSTNFGTFQASLEESTLNKIDETIPKAINTYQALEYWKFKRSDIQDRLIKVHNKNNKILLGFRLVIAALIIASAVVSPWFAIGLALSFISVLLLQARSSLVLMNHDKIGIQNMHIHMLLTGIKNNINSDKLLTPPQSAKLISILNDIIPIYLINEEDFIISIRKYNDTKNDTNLLSQQRAEFSLLKDDINHFSNLVFNDTQLIDYLHELDVNIEQTQLDIQNYNLDSFTLDDASEIILGNRYTPTNIETANLNVLSYSYRV
jgi:hypothetical protein